MKKLAIVMAAGLCLAPRFARAEEHAQMQEAKRNLETARSALQGADHDYGGQRKQALESIDQALRHINEGLRVVNARGDGVEHKEQETDQSSKAAHEKAKAKLREMESGSP